MFIIGKKTASIILYMIWNTCVLSRSDCLRTSREDTFPDSHCNVKQSLAKKSKTRFAKQFLHYHAFITIQQPCFDIKLRMKSWVTK